ncbi:MAG: D-alanine--D-alanine ligase [Thermoleophilaceae bacterium]|nr:D-alanine--D-alanine ligase [Thermoleophilaceae bacterium]
MRVAVLGGGRSSEHDISLASAETVRGGLAEAGHDVLDVRIRRDGLWSLAPEKLRGADVVFPAMHGPFGEDGTVQGLLQTLGIPYVGAGVLASALCLDKAAFKRFMAGSVPQVPYAVARDGEWPVAAPELPVFVKPAQQGSSVGIAKATTPEELEAAVREAWKHDPIAVIEGASDGLEVECGVIGHAEVEVSVPGEIAIKADWYDHDAKYEPGGMELVVPAQIEPQVAERVRELAATVFREAGCSGLARVDFFVEGDEVLVNELNTMPGFTPTSVFPKLWEASGVPYPELLDRLVGFALERAEAEKKYRY